MAKKKSKPKSPVLGRWRVVSMSTWDKDYINEEVPAFIEFDDRDGGSFQFGYVQGQIDCRTTNREGKPAVTRSRGRKGPCVCPCFGCTKTSWPIAGSLHFHHHRA